MERRQWVQQQTVPALAAGSVHVWRLSLDGTPAGAAAYATVLTAGERARADRYRNPTDRAHFIQSRWLLRHLLSQYVAVPAARLRLLTGAHGKPYLDPAMARIHFNLSHSHGLGLFAFAHSQRLGVDVEWIAPQGVTESLIRYAFSPAEQAVLFALPPAERIQSFYRGWTQKEAYLKGRGDGLSMEPGRVSVRLHPAEPAGLLGVEGERPETVDWLLSDLPPVPGFACALATEGPARLISCFKANW